MLNRIVLGALAGALFAVAGAPAYAAPDGEIRESIAICDPYNPTNCLTPNANGGLPGGTVTGTFTSSAPLANGNGGITGATLNTAPVGIVAAATTTRKALVISNQSNQGSVVTVCPANGPTPTLYAAGCYTFGPGGSYASPASGYVAQDAFNAVASAANTPITIEVH